MWDVGAGRAGGMIPIPPDLDLQRTLDNDGARETLYAKGGPFVELLARLGAFAHHPTEQTDYHDQKGSGYPRANMRKDRIPLDPTLLALVGDGDVNAREALMERGFGSAALAAATQQPKAPPPPEPAPTPRVVSSPTAPAPSVPALPPIDDAALERGLALALRDEDPSELDARSLALLGRVGALDYRYLAIDGQANYYNYEGGLADNLVTGEGIGLDGWSPIIRRPPPTSCARLRATARAGFALPSPPIPGRSSTT